LAEQVARPKVCVRLRLNKKIKGILPGTRGVDRIKGRTEMKSIDRIDQQPTAVDQPLLRLRNVFQDRRSGKDRRMGVTHMDPALDRRKGERRKKLAWLFK
jgi:hypothetical protein